ncbi:MAG: protein-glutamate O-methyltransferase CheR [Clostridiales bacterium]|nr:protein-glutamate O-methyltransferase CheR [Clostridiales bacterium]
MERYPDFMKNVYKLTSIDLSSYKEKQMKRRIESLAKRSGFDTFEKYFHALENDKSTLNKFINYMTINVSEFYRNPKQWEILKRDVIPLLIDKKRSIKIWSSACSMGEEPYSLVMMLTNFFSLEKITIIATDLDQEAMNKAKIGMYSAKSIANIPDEFVEKYFKPKGDGYLISESIKQRVTFKQHNLLKDNYPNQCDLIVCRNVLIYFTEEAKSEIFNKFNDALIDKGILFVGSTEQIVLPQRFKFSSYKTFFYQKNI